MPSPNPGQQGGGKKDDEDGEGEDEEGKDGKDQSKTCK